jgi:pantoate--beta-alanine ligase
MILFKKAKDLSEYIENQLLKDCKIGFVPTMGALHQGHISLLDKANAENNISIVSIFVNPTQFNNPEDFAKYPITLGADIEKLSKANCTILYAPSVQEMYPNGTTALQNYNIGNLDKSLEGEFRPGHFQGVCNVVHTLLLHTKPNNLYMGAKDYQQCMVVNKLIKITNLPIKLHVCPTLRETSGLAMSSRNKRLSEIGLQKAASIYAALNYIKDNKTYNWDSVKNKASKIITAQGLEMEYLILANATELNIMHEFDLEQPMVVLVAAYLEGVRLIDNFLV